MPPIGDNTFDQFSRGFERWLSQPRPIGNPKDSQAPTYPIERDLNYAATRLSSLGMSALEGDTKIDWPAIVPENLADLETIQKDVEALPVSEEQKEKYRAYISESRAVWEKMRSLPVASDGHLGFRKQVLSSFRFLADVYGFRLVDSTPIKVRYESPGLFVELEYSPECPELTFGLGNLAKAESSSHLFSLDDFFYWSGLGSFFDYGRFDLQSRDGVAALLTWAAQLIRDHAGPVLRNESGAFQLLVVKQRERELGLAGEMNR
jgi:hypothetical protein